MELILVTGGARGGKSRYAQTRALSLGGNAVTYIATATASDENMRARITRHRADRPDAWITIEAPCRAGSAILAAPTAVVLLDCITMLTANTIGAPGPEDEQAAIEPMLGEVEEVIAAAGQRAGILIAVTNEVGFSLHPPTALGRWYQNGLGLANQQLAAAADEVVMLVCGVPLLLKAKAGAR